MELFHHAPERSGSGSPILLRFAQRICATAVCLVAIAAGLLAPPARAQNLFFDVNPLTAPIDGGTANWTDADWKAAADSTTGGTWTANSTAVFDPIIGTPSTTTITLAGTQTATAVTFNGAGYTLTGGTLALAGTGASNWINVNSNATIESALTHLRFKGTREVTISGGGTIGTRAIVGDGVSGLVTVRQTGGTFTASEYFMVGGNNVAASQGAYIMDAGSLSIAQGIYLGWGGAGRSGGFTQNGGTVETLTNTQGIQIGIEGGSGTYTLNGGTLTSTFGTGAGYGGSFVFGGGTFRARASTTLYAGVATSIAAGATALIDTNGQTVTWGTALTGSAAAGLTKTGAGTLVLSANNTYTGTTTISAGTLQIGSGGTAGSVAGAIINDGSLVFNRSGDLTYLANVSGSGSVTKQGTSLIVFGGTNTYAGTTTISQGTLAVSAVTALPGWDVPGRVSVASGGALAVGNAVSDVQIDTLRASASFATGSSFGFDTRAGNRTYAGAIAGGVGVVKTGGNTLVLSGTNTYTGNTLITEGVIQAGSSAALGSGTVSTSGGAAINLNGFSFSNPFALNFQGAGPGTAGVLQNTNTVSTSVLNGSLSIGGENYVGGNGSVTLNGVVSGGGGGYAIYKQGTGTWTFANGANTFNGLYYQIGGTTAVTKLANLNQTSSLGQPTTSAANRVSFGFGGGGGGTLRFIGTSASTSDRVFILQGATDAASNRIDADGTTGTATLTLTGSISASRSGAYTAALGGSNAGVNTYSGAIGNGSGTVGLLKDGTTTWVLAGANTFTGGTTLAAGKLVLDYATQDNSKLGDAGVLTLGTSGGGAVGLELVGGSHTEVVASTTLAGPATIARPSGSSVIQLGAITRSGTQATLTLPEAGIATTSTRNTNGILGGWATVGGTDWAANATDADNGSIVAYSGYTDIDAQGSSIASAAASNVRINAPGSGGAIALAAGTTDINTLLQAAATPATIDTAGKTLRLGAAGGILLPAGSASVTIGSAAGDGTLTAGGADNTAGGITVTTLDATAATINAAITNNGSGPVSLSKTGPGTLTLAGASTFTGNTAINGGTLALSGGANRLPTGGTVTLNGGSLSTASNAQTVAGLTAAPGGGTVTGSGVLTNSGTYSLSGGGSLTVGNPLGGNLYAIGAGTLTISGGLSSTSNRIVAGAGASVVQTAGNFTTTNYMMVGRNDGAGGPATTGSATYTISSGSLTVGQGIYLGWTAGNSGTFTQNGGTVTTQTDQGIQIGIGGGTGSYVLNGGTLASNFGQGGGSYAGTFIFGGGTFRATTGFDTNRQAAVTTSIADGATARIDTNGQTVTWSNTLTGPAATGLVKSGSGTLNLNGNFTGDVSVTAGLLQARSATSLGTGTISATGITSSSGAVDLNGFSFTNPIVIGSRSAGPGAAGALQNTNTASTSVLDGNVSIGGENYVGGNGSITFNGVVSGGGSTVYSFFKQGSGTWTFANESNTFDGFYYLIGGTTAVTKLANQNEASSLGRPTTSGMNLVSFGLGGGGGGVIRYIGSSASTSDRVFLLQGATAAASNRIDADGTAASAALSLTGTLSAGRSGAYTAALGGTNAGVNTYSGTIGNGSGTVGLLKDGTTTWALSGTNTYSGTTAVSAGTLLINGNNAGAAGAVSVALAATLGGNGTVGGATTVSGTHSPGTSPGLQTFTNGLSYGSTGTLVWELSANTALTADRGVLYDGINLTTAGALAIDPAATLSLVFNQPLADATPSTVNWTDPFWGSDRQWVIANLSAPVTWDGTLFGTLLVGTDALGASLASVRPNASFSLANSGGDLVLAYVAVPEPGTWAMVGVAVAGMMALGCRRRTRNEC